MAKKESMWTKDITHHVLGTLAVFGLVVSSLVTMMGVTALSVTAQVAISQNRLASQAAAALLGDDRALSSGAMMQNASGTPTMHPPMASTTPPLFCPQLKRSISRGNKDATSTGDVTQLQMFIADHYGLPASTTISGYFGSTTQSYLQRFQREQGIPPAPTAGPVTRAAIARVCMGQGDSRDGQNGQMGSSTPREMDSRQPVPPVPNNNKDDNRYKASASTTMQAPQTQTTMPPTSDRNNNNSTVPASAPATIPTPPASPPTIPPVPPLPVPPKTIVPPPVSATFNNNAQNAASVVEAISEIGDGYSKLLQATLSTVGL